MPNVKRPEEASLRPPAEGRLILLVLAPLAYTPFWRVLDGWPDQGAVVLPRVTSRFPGMCGLKGGRGFRGVSPPT